MQQSFQYSFLRKNKIVWKIGRDFLGKMLNNVKN